LNCVLPPMDAVYSPDTPVTCHNALTTYPGSGVSRVYMEVIVVVKVVMIYLSV
jgi:hypothetical protein